MSLADEGKIVVTRQLGTAPLLFSIPTDNAQQGQHQQSAPESPPLTPKPNVIITLAEQLIGQEAMLTGRENGLQILLELSPHRESCIREELRKLRDERLALQSCWQVLTEFGWR